MVTKQVFKTRAEWLAYRSEKFVIGGSNIGVILGLSDYCTPLQLWIEWRDRAEKPIRDAQYRGRFMEDGIARWFTQQTGLKVVKRSAEIAVFRNDKYPDYVQVAPDREIFKEGTNLSGRPLLEIKDTARYVDFDEADSIPSEWFLQCQFEAAVCERPGTYLAVNDGSKTLKSRLILPDPAYVDECIRTACEWVEKHIIGGVQPEPINGRDVQLLHPESEKGIIKVGDKAMQLYEQALIYKRNAAEMERKYDALKDQISAMFDSRDTLEANGKVIATYKSQGVKSFDIERFRAEHPDLAEEYTKKTQYRKLVISRR